MNIKKISIGLLILLLALVVVPGASAYPSYVPSVAPSCGVCHVNPNGGGTLTPAGEYFKANGQLPPTPEPTPVPTPVPIPTPGQKAIATFVVTDNVTGYPIEDVNVSMNGVIIVTNDDGIAVFSDVSLGSYEYNITGEEYLDATGIVSVAGDTTVNVSLDPVVEEDEHCDEDHNKEGRHHDGDHEEDQHHDGDHEEGRHHDEDED